MPENEKTIFPLQNYVGIRKGTDIKCRVKRKLGVRVFERVLDRERIKCNWKLIKRISTIGTFF